MKYCRKGTRLLLLYARPNKDEEARKGLVGLKG